jgi:hypothetical protein
MIVHYGDPCWSPCAGKAAIRKESERRGTISRNPAWTESSVWNIYDVTGNKIAVANLVGQRTDPQTARFIEWFRSQPQ